MILAIEVGIPGNEFVLSKTDEIILCDERRTLQSYGIDKDSQISMKMNVDFSGIDSPGSSRGKSEEPENKKRKKSKQDVPETSRSADVEAQKEIEEKILLRNVQSNMEKAIEHTPEVFGVVTMLYINCTVNKVPLKAFVDSGAQATIMSSQAARKCSIHHLIDPRWQGIAHGIGTQTILGRIHMADLGIENIFIPTSFTILEHQPMDLLIGLDLLKRHQCCIDLMENRLVIGTTKTSTQFLSEAEIPSREKKSSNYTPDEKDVQELVKMGFNRNVVISALRKFHGNKELAIDSLVPN